jgi:hypothetical protein
MIRNHMIENADALKTAAMQRRNRGKHTGKSAQGWNAKRGEHEAGTWDHFHTVALTWFRDAASMAQEDYRRAVFPERYGDATLDDVIAANFASERDALMATF